jgi:nitrate reductase assembly molybdenum cofactor insertion protein NarJ
VSTTDFLGAFATFAQLIARPQASFAGIVTLAADGSAWPVEVERHVAEFCSRVRDLSLEELQELHDETFDPLSCRQAGGADPRRPTPLSRLWADDVALDFAAVSHWLEDAKTTRPGIGDAAHMLTIVGRLDNVLACERNPYHHVTAALHALLQGLIRS